MSLIAFALCLAIDFGNASILQLAIHHCPPMRFYQLKQRGCNRYQIQHQMRRFFTDLILIFRIQLLHFVLDTRRSIERFQFNGRSKGKAKGHSADDSKLGRLNGVRFWYTLVANNYTAISKWVILDFCILINQFARQSQYEPRSRLDASYRSERRYI